jgi:hypothetical protein
MAEILQAPTTDRTAYTLEGTMLEACVYGAARPNWAGDSPAGGDCFGFVAYRIHSGAIEGIDVAGLKLVTVAQIVSNGTGGIPRSVMFVDKRASRPERDAIVRAFTGQLGGALAAGGTLMSNAAGPYSVPMCHDIIDGEGMLRAGTVLEADFAPCEAPDDSIAAPAVFSTRPGWAARAVKVTNHRVNVLEHGMVWSFAAHSGICWEWAVEHAA